MMRIKQVDNGKWTVVHDVTGSVMLRAKVPCSNATAPMYFDTREEVKELCTQHGLYEVRAGNPDGLPEGTLVELVIGGKPT